MVGVHAQEDGAVLRLRIFFTSTRGDAEATTERGVASFLSNTSTCGIFVRCGNLLVVCGLPIGVADQNASTASLLATEDD